MIPKGTQSQIVSFPVANCSRGTHSSSRKSPTVNRKMSRAHLTTPLSTSVNSTDALSWLKGPVRPVKNLFRPLKTVIYSGIPTKQVPKTTLFKESSQVLSLLRSCLQGRQRGERSTSCLAKS